MTKRRRFVFILLLVGVTLVITPYIVGVTLKLAPYVSNSGVANKIKGKDQRATNQPMDRKGQILDIQTAYEQDSKKVDSLGKSKNLAEVKEVIQDLKRKWSLKQGPYYSLLMLKVCKTLNSVDVNDVQQYELAYRIAGEILEQPDKLPPWPAQGADVEAGLVLCLNRDLGDPSWSVAPNWKVRRRLNAEKFLSVWQRIQNETDLTFNFEDRPFINVLPPKGAGVTAGTDPAAIKDPAKRAEYEAAIEANRKKAEAYSLQHRLRTIAQVFLPQLKGYLLAAYSKAPSDNAELQKLLSQYQVDESLRREITKELNIPLPN